LAYKSRALMHAVSNIVFTVCVSMLQRGICHMALCLFVRPCVGHKSESYIKVAEQHRANNA